MNPFFVRLVRFALAATILCAPIVHAQEKPAPAPKPKQIAIRAGRLIDGKSDTPIANALILIEGDKIVSVTPGGTPPAGMELIDLSKATVLPGFVDAHTHVLLQGDITQEDYDAQLLKQSIPYRAILAARNAQIALSHGFTAMRDVETEGAMYADVDVKHAINNGEVPSCCKATSHRKTTTRNSSSNPSLTAPFLPLATRRLPSATASQPCVTSKPKAPCTPTLT